MSRPDFHEFEEPESGTRDASFGWCAREDCGYGRASLVHATQAERDAYDERQRTPPSSDWVITATAYGRTTVSWTERAPSAMAALIQISEQRALGLSR